MWPDDGSRLPSLLWKRSCRVRSRISYLTIRATGHTERKSWTTRRHSNQRRDTGADGSAR
eukprot:476812-Prymnesium_polylepis.1